MRTYFFIILVLMQCQLNAQTLQTVTNSGSTTTNPITTAGLTITSGTIKGDITNAPILTSKSTLGVNVQQVNIGNDFYNSNSYWSVFAHNTYNHYNGVSNQWIRRNHYGHTASLVMNNNGFTFNTGLGDGTSNFDQAHTMNAVMSILNNGHVGIGTSSPGTALTIVNTNDRDQFRLGQNTTNFYKIGRDVTDGLLYFQGTQSGFSGYNFRDELGNSQLYIKSNGQIGIGTITPGAYKLAVEGTIGARKLKITQSPTWADYVFDASYELMPLNQLEKYILKNKHLPEVPTSDEVEKNGLDIGDTQALLLKKIEELTLHLIEINKKLENQNNLIQQQQLELNKLKKKSSKQ